MLHASEIVFEIGQCSEEIADEKILAVNFPVINKSILFYRKTYILSLFFK